MNTKHTPGPWIYEASTRTIRAVPANYWLASMDSFDGAVNHEANARLIAAAPELLEALIDTLGMLDHYQSGRADNWDGSTKGQALSTIRDARAAIAKATGES